MSTSLILNFQFTANIFLCYDVISVFLMAVPTQRCITANVLQRKVDALCDKLATELN